MVFAAVGSGTQGLGSGAPAQHVTVPQPTPARRAGRLKLTLGCPVLDGLLRGGIPCGGCITEIVGEGAAGKTNICMQLMLNAQLPAAQGGLDGSAMLFYTDGMLPIERLQTLAHERRAGADALDHVSVPTHWCRDGPSLLHQLEQAGALLAERREEKPFRLLVVDSITAPFRDVGADPSVAQLAQRSELFFELAALLLRYAAAYNLAVVVTNQVTDFFADPANEAARRACTTAGLQLWSSGRRVVPALGLAWSSCVGQRLFVARTRLPDGAGGTLRRLCVIHSPFLPQAACAFMVERAGIRGVGSEQEQQAAQELGASVEQGPHATCSGTASVQGGVVRPG